MAKSKHRRHGVTRGPGKPPPSPEEVRRALLATNKPPLNPEEFRRVLLAEHVTNECAKSYAVRRGRFPKTTWRHHAFFCRHALAAWLGRRPDFTLPKQVAAEFR
jgi:hypothetical protein